MILAETAPPRSAPPLPLPPAPPLRCRHYRRRWTLQSDAGVDARLNHGMLTPTTTMITNAMRMTRSESGSDGSGGDLAWRPAPDPVVCGGNGHGSLAGPAG